MKNPTNIRRPVLFTTVVMLALLGVTACDRSKDTETDAAPADKNAVLPADEGREKDHAQGVAADMHNRMSAEQGNQKGAGQAGMADDQMGSGGMMDDHMPMGEAKMGDKPMGKSMAEPDAPKDKPMPMEDM